MVLNTLIWSQVTEHSFQLFLRLLSLKSSGKKIPFSIRADFFLFIPIVVCPVPNISIIGVDGARAIIHAMRPSLDRIYLYRAVFWHDSGDFSFVAETDWQQNQTFSIEGLYPGVSYNYTISVFANRSSNGRGHDCQPRTSEIVAFSLPDSIASAPSEVSCVAKSFSTILCTCTLPDYQHRGGTISSVEVFFARLANQSRSNQNVNGSGVISFSIQVTSNSKIAISFNLSEIAMSYSLSFALRNLAGVGNMSNPIFIKTLESGKVSQIFASQKILH